jgi:hypothetical protein
MVSRMAVRRRRHAAAGPADWLLTFLAAANVAADSPGASVPGDRDEHERDRRERSADRGPVYAGDPFAGLERDSI